MKLFSRRKVAAAIPVAPIAAGISARNYGLDAPPPPIETMGMLVEEKVARDIERVHIPAGWRDFSRERNAFHAAMRMRERYSSAFPVDLDIESLRSVSRQHKQRMQVAKQERLMQERESFLESLARKFNVLEFWKGKDGLESYYSGDAQPAQTNYY